MVAADAIKQALAEYGDDKVGRAAIEMLAPVLRALDADRARLDYLDRCEGAFRYPGTGEAYDYDYYFDEPARKIGKLGSARDVLDKAMKEHP